MGSTASIQAKVDSIKSSLILFATGLLLAFVQGCSPAKFTREPEIVVGLGIQTFVTSEDTPITEHLMTHALRWNRTSVMQVTRQPAFGQFGDFNSETGQFTYTPNRDFFGEDGFEIAELVEGESQSRSLVVVIDVRSQNDLPVVLTDFVNTELNTPKDFEIAVRDLEDVLAFPGLSSDGAVTEMATTKGGLVKKVGNLFRYTPPSGFRGADSVLAFAIDHGGAFSSKTLTLNVGNPFFDIQPAMAVRDSGCITCHANVKSAYVTDFGAGSSYFMGGANPHFRMTYGDVWTNQATNVAWITTFSTMNVKEVVVPRVDLNRDLRVGVPEQFLGYPQFQSTVRTLKDYLTAIEEGTVQLRALLSSSMIPASQVQINPQVARVTEKATVFIGAPTAAQIKSAFSLGTTVPPFSFSKDEEQSPNLSGLEDKGSYFQNHQGAASELVCDGDLFVSRPLYLKNLRLKTKNGCRIYSLATIFVEGPITYLNLSTDKNDTNLQLTSAKAVMMGVGTSHCESATNPGRYYSTGLPNPMSWRFEHRRGEQFTRGTPDMASILANHNSILSEAGLLNGGSGLQDASCQINGSLPPRQIAFERILINAPIVQSRYTGQVTGVIIAELPLFSLTSFAFEFDPVFKRVAILPLLPEGSFLVVK